mgnify:CR=1 FL=1
MSTAPATMPVVKTGRVRILASAGTRRSGLMPDIPTFTESGLPGVVMTNWYSVMARGGTPRPIIKKLHDELIRAMEGAHVALLDIEELSDEELADIRRRYEQLARKAREEMRRGGRDTGTPEVE